jgi:uncharacterized membrane protein
VIAGFAWRSRIADRARRSTAAAGGLRCALIAGLVAATICTPAAVAQTATPGNPEAALAAPPGEAAGQGGTSQREASLTTSATKATTFKIATVVTNMVIFSTGTASLAGGTLLTAFNVTKSWLLYTVNDYAWDTYAPLDKKPAGASTDFDASASAWRTTEKFLTYKPVDTAIKFASIYLWTGSVPAMVVLGTASSVANTVIFYANNFAWDLYDWSRAPPGKMTASAP